MDNLRYWLNPEGEYVISSDDMGARGYLEITKRPDLYPDAYAWNRDYLLWIVDPEGARKVIADVRYLHETSGIVYDGNKYETSDRSKLMFANAAIKCMRDAEKTFNWKTAEGKFVELTSKDIFAIHDIIVEHIDKCFERERELNRYIDDNMLAVSDVDVGWPDTPVEEPQAEA